MAKTFQLTILTVEREFFRGEVEMLTIEAPDGEVGILAGHMPMVVAVEPGEVRILQDGVWRSAAAASGFATVLQDAVLLVTQAAEWPEEIDIARAKHAQSVAEEQLRQKQSMLEYQQAQMMLRRAMARLKVSGK